MRYLFLLVAVLFLSCTAGLAQVWDNVEEVVSEELLDAELSGWEAESGGEDLLAHLQRLRRNPVNINSASRKDLSSIMLLTDFQIESILQRVIQSGAILSFSELSLLYGFDEKTVERIRPFIVLGPSSVQKKGFFKDQKTSIYTKYQRAFAPDREQLLSRVRFSYLDKVDASVVYKGASDASSRNTLSTLSVSFSGLLLSGSKSLLSGSKSLQGGSKSLQGGSLWNGGLVLERVVVGDFYARLGQGLCSWNGFSFSAASESAGFVKNAEPFSVYTSSDTSKLLRGAAAVLSWRRLTFGAGYAFQGNVFLARMSYMFRRVRYGVSYSRKASENQVVAADVLVGGRGLCAFAEGAFSLTLNRPQASNYPSQGISMVGGWAFLGGATVDIGNYAVHFLGRSYQDSFYSALGGAYSSSGKAQNQQGVGLRIAGPVYRKLSLALGADYTAYPEPRFRVKVPSSDVRCYLKFVADDSGFEVAARNQLWIKGSVKYDTKYGSSVETDNYYSVKVGGLLSVGKYLVLGTRLEANTSGGRAASITLKMSLRRGFAVLSAGAAVFDAEKWDGRIYFPQAELPYSFSSALLYGKGLDGWVMVKTRPSRKLSLYLKYQYNRRKNLLKGALSLEL